MKNGKTEKERDFITEATDMFNDLEDTNSDTVPGMEINGLEGDNADPAMDEDADFMGGEISDLDDLGELEDVGDEEVQSSLQAAADAIQDAAQATGVEISAGGGMDDMEGMEDMEGMDDTLALALAGKGVLSMEDLAEQSIDELMDIEGMNEERACKLIMTARAPWFE